MKILEIMIEAILSPFSSLLRLSGVGKNGLSTLAKPLIIIAIAIVITTILILYFYRKEIFS